MVSESTDGVSLLFYVAVIFIFIALEFIFVKVMLIYELGVTLIFFVMIANFVVIIVPIYMIY